MAAKAPSKRSLSGLNENKVVTISFRYNDEEFEDAESNLQLDDISVEKLRVYLNRAPAKYAYWSSIKAQINKQLSETKTEYDIWFNERYHRVCLSNEKATETYKKTQVMIDNAKDYRAKQAAIRELEYAVEQASTLVKSYEMQSRTLQTIASLLRTEMELS